MPRKQETFILLWPPCWQQVSFKAVFHSCISPPLAKNYDNKIIFLGSFAAGETCAAPPVAENFQLLLDLLLMAQKNQLIKFFGGEIFRQRRRNGQVENGLQANFDYTNSYKVVHQGHSIGNEQ